MYAKFYIPRDERVTLVKIPGLEQEDAIEVASRKMMPALFALYSTQVEYESLDQVFDLFRKGVTLSTDVKCGTDSDSEAETVTFRLPKVVAGNYLKRISILVKLERQISAIHLLTFAITLAPRLMYSPHDLY